MYRMFINNTHQKAHEALKKENIEEAIALYLKALQEDKDHPDIISDIAVAYLHANDRKNSLAYFNQAVEKQPDYGYRYASRGFARKHFGDFEGALQDYEKAVNLDPEDSVAHNNLGLLLEEKGYKKEAEDRFARADALSKMEGNLLNVIDELETPGKEKKEEIPEPIEAKSSIQEEEEEEEEEIRTASSELKRVFVSKGGFREFLQFIKNGFKIK